MELVFFCSDVRLINRLHMAFCTASSILSVGAPATPSFIAAFATAIATRFRHAAKILYLGQQGCAGFGNIDKTGYGGCGSRKHIFRDQPGFHDNGARPRPGNTKALLELPDRILRSSYATGPNGLPVAISALPSVHSIKLPGVASAKAVGFDICMMMPFHVPPSL